MFESKKSVYMGWSMAEVSQIKDCLMQSNIWYKEKLLDHLGERSIDGTVRSHIGTSVLYHSQLAKPHSLFCHLRRCHQST